MRNRVLLSTERIFLILLVGTFISYAGNQIEMENLRGYHHKTFLNEDGSYTTEVSLGYVHYRDATGIFKEINRNFQSSTDPRYSHEITDGLYHIFFEKVTTPGLSFIFQPQNGSPIRCSIKAVVYYDSSLGQKAVIRNISASTPVVTGNTILFSNVFPGIDVHYTYTDNKFKEEIMFSDQARRALPLPSTLGLGTQNIYIGFLTQVEMDTALDAYVNNQKVSHLVSGPRNRIAWNYMGNSPVEFRSSAGTSQFFFPHDFALNAAFQDSAISASHSQIIQRKFYSDETGDYLLNLVPLDWLRTQPQGTIIFDPQIVVISLNNDTWIEYGSSSSFGSYDNIRVGRGSSSGWKRSLLKFNLSGVVPDNAIINSAFCKLYWYTSWKASGGIYVDRAVFLHQLLKDWLESQADWTEAKTGVNWNTAGVGFNDIDAKSTSEDMLIWGASGYPRWMDYNVTSLVKRWIDGVSINYGMILWAANENDYSNADEKRIYSSNWSDESKRPRLMINYTLADLVKFTYTPVGTIDSIYFSENVIKGNYDYTIRDWVNNISYKDINGTTVFDVDYTHDFTGNIWTQNYTNLTETDQISYHYDPSYQLRSAVCSQRNDQEFGYDVNGNIKWKKVNTDSTAFQYDTNKPNRLLQVGSRYFSYDANGNITGNGSLTLNYDYKNQTTGTTNQVHETYAYDSEGLRVKKSEGDLVTSGDAYNVEEWKMELTGPVDGVPPTNGRSMYRMTVKTASGYGDHRTDDLMVIQSGLNMALTAGSYLEYDIRAAQSTYMRGSVQFYYYDPSTQQYAYSSNLTYQDQNGVSNKWDTDLNSRYNNTWYHRVLPLQSLQGKIIKKVFFLTDDQPSTTGPLTYIFYCDEVKIDGQDIGKANGTSFSPTAFYENFNDGNIHDGNPVNWYTTGSYWTVSSGNLFWNSVASTSGQCSNPELTFDDFEASFDLKADGYYSTSHWAAFAFRKTNYDHWYTSSGYMVYYRYNGQICLSKPGGDIATANTGKNLSAWRKVKIVAYGNSIKVYVDGVLQINATDNTYTQGYFGLNVFGVSARYDNLTIDGNPFENEIYYIRDIEGNVIAEYDGGGNLLAEYIYGNGQRLGKINADGKVDYYLNDHLGSARTMVGSGWSANYYPFGEIASQTGSNEDTHFDFTGQERDRGTGLMYFGARYYDPSISRFISPDPMSNEFPTYNSYNFCFNRPLQFIDPNGKGPAGAHSFFNKYINDYIKDLYDCTWDQVPKGLNICAWVAAIFQQHYLVLGFHSSAIIIEVTRGEITSPGIGFVNAVITEIVHKYPYAVIGTTTIQVIYDLFLKDYTEEQVIEILETILPPDETNDSDSDTNNQDNTNNENTDNNNTESNNEHILDAAEEIQNTFEK